MLFIETIYGQTTQTANVFTDSWQTNFIMLGSVVAISLFAEFSLAATASDAPSTTELRHSDGGSERYASHSLSIRMTLMAGFYTIGWCYGGS